LVSRVICSGRGPGPCYCTLLKSDNKRKEFHDRRFVEGIRCCRRALFLLITVPVALLGGTEGHPVGRLPGFETLSRWGIVCFHASGSCRTQFGFRADHLLPLVALRRWLAPMLGQLGWIAKWVGADGHGRHWCRAMTVSHAE